MKNFLSTSLKRFCPFKIQFSTLFLFSIILNNAVVVQWLPNSEQDLAGYKVYYGTASRSYSKTIPAGLTTEQSITDLQPGYEYFFAVTAYDTAGNESQYSNEVSIYIADDNDDNDDNNSISSDHQNAYNFPNPFNPEIQSTQIRYHLSKSEEVSIKIFNVGGNKIRTLFKNVWKTPGEHAHDSWDGRDDKGNVVPNGIYYASVTSQSLDHYITIAVTR